MLHGDHYPLISDWPDPLVSPCRSPTVCMEWSWTEVSLTRPQGSQPSKEGRTLADGEDSGQALPTQPLSPSWCAHPPALPSPRPFHPLPSAASLCV